MESPTSTAAVLFLVCLHCLAVGGNYVFLPTVMTYDEAVSACTNESLAPATIPDAASNNMALAAASYRYVLPFHGEVIIGLRRVSNGVWVWPDQSPASWTNWLPGEPSYGDCCKMLANGSWVAIHCTAPFRVMCGTGGNGSRATSYEGAAAEGGARHATFVDVGETAMLLTSLMTSHRPHDLACARLCATTSSCDVGVFTRATQHCDLYSANVGVTSLLPPVPKAGYWVKNLVL